MNPTCVEDSPVQLFKAAKRMHNIINSEPENNPAEMHHPMVPGSFGSTDDALLPCSFGKISKEFD
jgi:hypothetical protein